MQVLDDYDPQADFWAGWHEALAIVRERKAKGGKGWLDMNYSLPCTIVDIKEETRRVYSGGIGKDAKFVEQNAGWWVVFQIADASRFSMLFPFKPDLDPAKPTYVKITREQPDGQRDPEPLPVSAEGGPADDFDRSG